MLRGDAYAGSKSVTFGTLLANTVPVVPSAHWVGTEPGSDAYALQFGIGVAAPVHVSCYVPLGKPVLAMA